MTPILMIVAFNMSEYKSFINILKLRSSDSLVLGVTYLLTVFVNLTAAVQIGLLLAMVSFVKRMSEVLEVDKVIPKNNHGSQETEIGTYGNKCPQLSVFTVEGALFFGAADRFEKIITQTINKLPEVMVLNMKRVSFMDATAIANLTSLTNDFKKKGGTLLIADLNNDTIKMMKISGLYETIGTAH